MLKIIYWASYSFLDDLAAGTGGATAKGAIEGFGKKLTKKLPKRYQQIAEDFLEEKAEWAGEKVEKYIKKRLGDDKNELSGKALLFIDLLMKPHREDSFWRASICNKKKIH